MTNPFTMAPVRYPRGPASGRTQYRIGGCACRASGAWRDRPINWSTGLPATTSSKFWLLSVTAILRRESEFHDKPSDAQGPGHLTRMNRVRRASMLRGLRRSKARNQLLPNQQPEAEFRRKKGRNRSGNRDTLAAGSISYLEYQSSCVRHGRGGDIRV